MSDGLTLVVACADRYPDAERAERAIEKMIRTRGVKRIGCTGGMEKFAKPVADRLGVALKVYPAEYRRYGPTGAAIRNVHMLEDANPDIVIGFTEILDENTVDLLRRAAKAGIPAYLVSSTVLAPPEK